MFRLLNTKQNNESIYTTHLSLYLTSLYQNIAIFSFNLSEFERIPHVFSVLI